MKKAFKSVIKFTALGAAGYFAFDFAVTHVSDAYLTPIKSTKLGIAFERIKKNRQLIDFSCGGESYYGNALFQKLKNGEFFRYAMVSIIVVLCMHGLAMYFGGCRLTTLRSCAEAPCCLW